MKKRDLFWWTGGLFVLVGVFFFTRLISIKELPPFNDEFIYVRWAQEGFFDPAKRLLSLTDGKQPLYIWLVSLAMNGIHSPLAAGRIVSVVSGAITMAGLMILAWRLFRNKTVVFIAGLLYILYPLGLLLDRFALYDSLLACLSVWSAVVMLFLADMPALGTAFILAMLLGSALLTKSSAVLMLGVLPISILLFTKTWRMRAKAFAYFLFACAIAFVYQSVQFLSPDASFVASKNQTFIYTLNELQDLPVLRHAWENLLLFGSWLVSYLTVPVLLLAAAPFISGGKDRRPLWYLALLFGIPFLAVVFIGKLIYTRHFFFLTLPVLVLAAQGTGILAKRLRLLWQRVLVGTILLFPMLVADGKMLADFKTAPLPAVDRFQYIDGWPAGWGVKEIVRYLERQSAQGELTILTEGEFGSLPTTAMNLYFGNYPQIHIVPINDQKTFAISSFIQWSSPVYMILNISQNLPEPFTGDEIMKIRKGNGDSYIRLYRLKMVDDEGLGPPTSSV